jgi:hypothetical protein
MKTATFKVYRPWLATGAVVDVLYRGRVLASFDCDDELNLMNRARVWATNQGFTRIKYLRGQV